MTPLQQEQIIEIIRSAARAEIIPRFRNLAASDIAEKAHAGDLVTAADTAAEEVITQELHQLFPNALVVGEEAATADPALLDQIADAPLAFIIDPVDGTWNFAKGLAVFGVILSATRFGVPIFGLIYDPLADDWAIADEIGNARMITASGATRPLQVAMGKPLAGLSGHVPFHMFEGQKKRQLATTLARFQQSEALRCSAHEYRMVAQGHTDFVLTKSLWPWDHAAGALICAQAGAHVEMLDGGPYSAARHSGHLLIAPDQATWRELQKVFAFLLDTDD